MRAVRLQRVHAVDRRRYLLARCRGRSVLHLGCADHPFLEARLARGDLLHAALAGVADLLYGVDLDEVGVQRLRAEGYENVVVGDVEHLDALALDRSLERRFEVVVAGELLEHLANPGRFLRAVPHVLSPGGQLLLTVPNAASLRAAVNALRARENVHPDHVAYYSPVTLTRLLEAHGFAVDELRPYWAPARTRPLGLALYDHALRSVRRVGPWLGEGLVALATYRGEDR